MKTKNIQRFMKIASKDIHGAFGGLLSMSLSPDLVDYYYCPEFESPEKQNLKQIGWRLKDVGYMQSAILGNNAWYHLARNEDHTFKVVEEIPVESL
jgi:hypothetical protein